MSIRPQYASRILSGEKQIELRKRRPRLVEGDLVLLYVTSPVCRVMGAFSVSEVIAASVESMWRRHRAVLGVERDAYDAYFHDRQTAYGVAIKTVREARPVSLQTLRRRFEGFVPPQSYMFWPDRWALPPSWRF